MLRRPGVAILVDITEIVDMFIINTQEKLQ